MSEARLNLGGKFGSYLKKISFKNSLRTTNTRPYKKPLGILFSIIAGAAFLSGGLLARALDKPVFNNLPEDNATLLVAKSGQPWTDKVDTTIGEYLTLQVWDHNTVVGTTAQNVNIKVTLPTNPAKNLYPQATVSADNADSVSGIVTVSSNTENTLSYVDGSAELLKNVNGHMTKVNWPTNINPDEVVTKGINLGNQDGCWPYVQAVRITVRINGSRTQINTNKRVELTGGAKLFDVTADAQPGDMVSYKIFVQNTGDVTGRDVKVVDTLDSKLTYIPESSFLLVKVNNADQTLILQDKDITFSGKTITWHFADMAPSPDAAFYLIFKARVANKDAFQVGKTVINNVATSSFYGASEVTNNVVVNVTKQVEPVVSFSLRKEVKNITNGDSKWYDQQLASAAPGDTISYRLILVNTGNTTANNVYLKDILPAGVTYDNNAKLYNTQIPNGVAINGSSLFTTGYLIPTIVNGNDNLQTIIFNARLTNNCSGQQNLVNKSQAIYNNAVRAQDDATVIFSCTRGMIITKDIQDPKTGAYVDQIGVVRESQILSYRINVQNNGNTTLTNPILRDILPSQVDYVANSLSIDGEFMSIDIQSAFFNQGIVLTNLTPGLGKDVRFQVRIKDCPPLGNMILTNTAFTKADGVTEISDTAKATLQVSVPTL